MSTNWFWLLLAGLFLNFRIIFSDEDCHLMHKPKLQIIFVVDQVLKAHSEALVVTQNLTASYLIDFFKQNNYHAEYAVAGYVDYPDTANPRAITKSLVQHKAIKLNYKL